MTDLCTRSIYIPETKFNTLTIASLSSPSITLQGGNTGDILTCADNIGTAQWTAFPAIESGNLFNPSVAHDGGTMNAVVTNYKWTRVGDIVKYNFNLQFDWYGVVGDEGYTSLSVPVNSTFTSVYDNMSVGFRKDFNYSLNSIYGRCYNLGNDIIIRYSPNTTGQSYFLAIQGFYVIRPAP